MTAKNEKTACCCKTTTTEGVLSPELKAFILSWKDQPGNLVMVLHRVQMDIGYIPREAAFEVAPLLEIPLARIYGVLTFYNFFKLKKPGKYNIQVCLGTACYLKGAEDILLELERQLGVGINAVTPDGLFSVEAVRCVGCCGLGPVLTVSSDKGVDTYGKLNKEMIPEIIAKYRKA